MGAELRIGVVVKSGKQLGSGLEELRAALADLGHADPPWIEVAKSKQAQRAVRSLVGSGVNRVLVWGGDGAVRRAINAVVGGELDASIGIVPAGTANLLAHNLGIPVDLRRAVEIAVHGDPRPIDVGEMNGTNFAVMAGAGFDALMIGDADESGLKERWGRLGYVVAGARHRSISPAAARIDVDGTPWYRGDASCVVVANVGTVLGGLSVFPEASPIDGRLEVGVVAARSAWDWVRVLASATLRRAERSPLARTTSAETVSIEFDRSLPWEVDGGQRGRERHFEIRCLPQAVRICQPPTAAGEERR